MMTDQVNIVISLKNETPSSRKTRQRLSGIYAGIFRSLAKTPDNPCRISGVTFVFFILNDYKIFTIGTIGSSAEDFFRGLLAEHLQKEWDAPVEIVHL